VDAEGLNGDSRWKSFKEKFVFPLKKPLTGLQIDVV